MRRFSFPLAKVRGLRAQQERVARRELGSALSELAALDVELRRVRADLDACRDEEHGLAAALAAALADGLARTRGQLETRRLEATAAVDFARQAYGARRRDLRALNRLLEQRREAWRRDCLAEEHAEMEDLSRMRAHRNRQEAART